MCKCSVAFAKTQWGEDKKAKTRKYDMQAKAQSNIILRLYVLDTRLRLASCDIIKSRNKQITFFPHIICWGNLTFHKTIKNKRLIHSYQVKYHKQYEFTYKKSTKMAVILQCLFIHSLTLSSENLLKKSEIIFKHLTLLQSDLKHVGNHSRLNF